MSRRHDARVYGEVHVEMVCDVCGKRQWVRVSVSEDDTCAEYKATKGGWWQYADDALVCSDACYRSFWDGMDML